MLPSGLQQQLMTCTLLFPCPHSSTASGDCSSHPHGFDVNCCPYVCCLPQCRRVATLQDMGPDALLWSYYHCCDCDDPDCNSHKPDGCYGRSDDPLCPWCLVLPVLVLLQKVSNHLELLRPDPSDATKAPRKVTPGPVSGGVLAVAADREGGGCEGLCSEHAAL